MTAPTHRLYLEDARRRTALAKVVATFPGGFLLDRTLLHAADRSYHHAQPCDRGHVLADGHKLKVHKVGWDRGGVLVHRTDGPPPPVGAQAQVHLDAERRDHQARAHLAMHLVAHALAEARHELLAPPDVVGGGEARFAAKFREDPKTALVKVRSRVQQLVDARLPVEASWVTREDAARACVPQGVPLDDVAPGEPTLRIVRVGEKALPCDAPLPDRTHVVGEVRFALASPGAEGARFRVRVA